MLKRPTWDESDNYFNPKDDLAALDAELLATRMWVMQELERLPRNDSFWGLGHLDLHFANFDVTPEDDIVLLDFDDCAYGWFVMDIAMLLFDVVVLFGTRPENRLSERFFDALLEGYRMEKPLSDSASLSCPHS